jgi:uncharacterized protein
VLNRYLDLIGEDDGIAAIPLFLSSRAATRAHVTAATMDRATRPGVNAEIAVEARRYLDLSTRFLRPRSPRLVAMGSLSGTGKSTLAAALAPSLGARVLRSDVVRKSCSKFLPKRGCRRARIHVRCRAASIRRCDERLPRRSPPRIR